MEALGAARALVDHAQRAGRPGVQGLADRPVAARPRAAPGPRRCSVLRPCCARTCAPTTPSTSGGRTRTVSIAQHRAGAVRRTTPTNWMDRWSVAVRGHLFNHLFLEALHTGALRVPGCSSENLPVARTLDFIGVNYYTRDFVRNSRLQPARPGGRVRARATTASSAASSTTWAGRSTRRGSRQFLREFSRYKLPHPDHRERHPDRATTTTAGCSIFMHLWQVARAIAGRC